MNDSAGHKFSVRGQEEKTNQTNKKTNSGVKNEKEAFYNWGGEKEI